ncbi:glycosyltransferase family 4 protein [Williamsia herbipolensis]|uniref:Glycosyltransferase family 4 protein n=1 Tax=Williamsia herbipolensis TaxID=1603258 RepID=A0AAU4K6L8_9NOCA|nr:glycosyltransferase family 4 protein [Williamsia herbipolensis]
MESVAFRPGGLNRYFAALCKEFERMPDWDTRVIRWSDHVTVKRAGVVGTAKRVVFYLRKGLDDRSEIVDSHFSFYGLAYILGRSLSGRKSGYTFISHFHGPWYAESRIAKPRRLNSFKFKRLIEKFVYSRSTIIVVLSEFFRDYLVEHFGVEGEKIHILKPGVDTEWFFYREFDKPRLSATNLLAVRRLDARMGLDVAIRALPHMDPSATLTIAGDGRERGSLEGLVSELGLMGRVHFAGKVSDRQLVTLYQTHDATVVPSIALEGFGMVVLESLSCGTPVVASRLGGLVEALEEFDSSLLVDPGSPEALASRISAVVASGAPTRESCRAFALSHEWSSVAKNHSDLYRASRDG